MRSVDLEHDGLGKFRRIAGFAAVEEKASAQKQIWDKQWQRRQTLERKFFAGPNAAALQALKKLQADEQSEEANREIVGLASILLNALRSKPSIRWAQDVGEFSESQPVAPVALPIPREPRKREFRSPPPRSLFELLAVKQHRAQKAAAEQKFKDAHGAWTHAVGWNAREHDAAMKKYRAAMSDWEARRFAFQTAQSETATRLGALRNRYSSKRPDAVIAYNDMVLHAADRPEGFPVHWQIGFAAGALTIDYDLPSTDQMPQVKAMKYIGARDAFETLRLPEDERDRLYAEAVYQTCLSVLHLLFASDAADAIRSVAFKGWVNFVDQVHGRPGRACIMSVHATKEEFRKIDLSAVDPQACFRALNGTVSTKLAAMTAAPADRQRS